MFQSLRIIAITRPDAISGEAVKIRSILESGAADLIHIRKPHWSLEQTRQLIEEIPSNLRHRLKLHDHFSLCLEMDLGGVHLNSRNPVAPEGVRSVSRSIHDIEQLHLSEHYEYITLSPIFDSISKEGYKSAFSLKDLEPLIVGKRVVALGGVTPERFPELISSGFYGAAMLGYFWPMP